MTETKPVTASAVSPAAEPVVRRKRKLRPKKIIKWVVILLVLAALILLAARFFLRRNNLGIEQLTYTETAVGTRTITRSLSGSGTLQPANSYTVTTLIQGEVLSAGFEEGDIVEQDTVLYQVDSSDAANNIERSQISLNQARRSYQSTIDLPYIRSNSAGTVISLEVEVGDEVNQGQTVASIRDSATMELRVPFPSDDAVTFSVGQQADVILDGSFETLYGTVKSISGVDTVGVGNMVTRDVTISVTNPGGLSSTQTAAASVNGLGCAGNGTFTYRSESTVTAGASGTVTAVHVQEGSAVSKDTLLITLGGDNIENQLQNAADSLRTAELSMESTQEQLENYTITSPISGTIVDKQYKAGDTVEAGRTLCIIYDLSYLEMILNIDELDISSMAVGQPVRVTADAVDGRAFEGVVTKVSVAGTTSGGITSYPVTIRIDETEGLLPGMNVDAEIVIEEVSDVLSVPNAAVSRGRGNISQVLVTATSPSASSALEDQDAPEGYVYVRVETGVSDDDYVQIVSGLQQGDTVAYIPQAGSSGGMMFGMMGGMPGGMPPAGGGGMGGGMPAGGGGMPSGGGNRGGMGGGFPR